MKIFIFLFLSVLGLNFVNSLITRKNSSSTNDIDFNNLLTNAKDLLKFAFNEEMKSEIYEAIKDINDAKNLKIPLNPPIKIRKKREASPDCQSIQSQVTSIQSQIGNLQKTIANQTQTLNGHNQKVAEYERKMLTAGWMYNLFSAMKSIYAALATSAQTALNNSKAQLATLQEQERLLLYAYELKCSQSSPCGLFTYYDTYNGRSDPEINGFVGGKFYIDNSNAYVGYGSATGCQNQLIAPGSISTSFNSPGIKVPCGANEINDRDTAYYLLYHPNLTWVPTSALNMFDVPNTLKINAAGLTFLFGRALIDGRYLFGKVFTGGSSSGLNVAGPSGNSLIKTGFDVLACSMSLNSPIPTQAPVTDPPWTTAQPIYTQPPATNGPVMQAPTTNEPIYTQPPVTNPPVTQAPTTIQPVYTQPPVTNAPSTNPQSMKIFCYWPWWYMESSNIKLSLCTHVTYAFFKLDMSGNIFDQGGISNFLAAKNANPNVKFLISIGGAATSGNFHAISSNDALRRTFVNNIVNYVRNNNLHGVDLDWEGYKPEVNQPTNYGNLLEDLWNILHPEGLLVTIAAQSDKDEALIRYDISRMSRTVDHINLMTYDFHGSAWEDKTGFGSPIYSSDPDDIYTVDQTVKFWISQVGEAKKSMINLGMPFYGTIWTLNPGSTNEPGQAGKNATEWGVISYAEICQNLKSNSWTRVYNDVAKIPYAYGNGKWTSYDDIQSHQEKIKYLFQMGLGGVKIWNVGDDDIDNACDGGASPLLTSISQQLRSGSTSAPSYTQPPATNGPVYTQPPTTNAPVYTQPPATNPPPSNSQSRPLFCYWAWWTADADINPSLCTHISFAFFGLDDSGTITPLGNTDKFLALRYSHPNIKLLISLGGAFGGYYSKFEYISTDASRRQTFVNNILTYIESNQIHGVDIDWENEWNHANSGAFNQPQYFGDLLEDLWNTLNPKGYLVTTAVQVGLEDKRYDIPRMANNVNFINLMTYDFHGSSWESNTGFNTPMNSNDDLDIPRAVDNWISKLGSKKNILLLGFAFYGPIWKLSSSSTSVGSTGNAPPSPEEAQISYANICSKITSNGWTRVYDDFAKVPYAYGDGYWASYDDATSIQEKITLLKSRGIGGAFIWELSQDDLAGNCNNGKYPLTTLLRNAMSSP